MMPADELWRSQQSYSKDYSPKCLVDEFSEVAPSSRLCYRACKRSGGERGERRRYMRRVVLVLGAMALALLLASGVAWAVNKIGTDGPDTLRGTNRADNLSGKAGNDVLYGLGGRDNLRGGSGKDLVFGGSQRRLSGGDKNLVGGRGHDVVLGGVGSD